MGLTRESASKAQQVKTESSVITAATSPTTRMNTEMKQMQEFIERNREEIKRSVNKIVEEQALIILKYERNEFSKNLQLAQENIITLDKYLKLAMDQIQRESTSTHTKLSEKISKLTASNETVTRVMDIEGERLTTQSKKIIEELGKNSKTAIEESMTQLNIKLGEIVTRHEKIANIVEEMYNFKGAWTVVRWGMVFTSWVMLMSMTKAMTGGTWGGLFKAMLGGELF